jgi:hypothetical protein
LQRALVGQHDIAAAVADEATPLQGAGRWGHVFAPHTEHLATILEPLLIVLAVLLPIIELNQMVR